MSSSAVGTDMRPVNGNERDPLVPPIKIPVARVNRGYFLSILNTAGAIGIGTVVIVKPDENTLKIAGAVALGLLAVNAVFGWVGVIWTRPRQIEPSQLKPSDVIIQRTVLRELSGNESNLLMLEGTDLEAPTVSIGDEQAKIERLEGRIRELEQGGSNSEALAGEVAELKLTLGEAQDSKTALEGRIRELEQAESNSKSIAGEVETLKHSLGEAKAAKTTLEGKILELEQAGKQSEALERKVADSERKVADSEREIIRLTAKIFDLRIASIAAEDTSSRTIEKLESALEALRQQHAAAIQTSSADDKQEIEDLTIKLERKTSELAQAKAEFEALQKELATVKDENARRDQKQTDYIDKLKAGLKEEVERHNALKEKVRAAKEKESERKAAKKVDTSSVNGSAPSSVSASHRKKPSDEMK